MPVQQHPAPLSPQKESATVDQDFTELPPNHQAMPRLMKQQDLATYLGKSTAWCERARWAGDGPKYLRLGRHIRYRASDVEEWMDSCVRQSTSEVQS